MTITTATIIIQMPLGSTDHMRIVKLGEHYEWEITYASAKINSSNQRYSLPEVACRFGIEFWLSGN